MSTPKNNRILVRDVMMTPDQFPIIKKTILFKEALEEMGNYGLGTVCIVDNNNKLCGILTDGDIRRKLLKVQKPFSAFFVDDASLHSITEPICCKASDLLYNAVTIMGEKNVWDLPVVNKDQKLLGLLHLHPAIKILLER
ncbi:MAG: CBS domain-containing protein [Candidatus Marinimicrobia bacterium]|nr:CBS domain-containing protein [Candidatus Neomarinimicrobiota bacterium]|tara:strand:+ start:12871 stop:13290 length:420 start_codon:yes stop_codon:yes gene_type:complete